MMARMISMTARLPALLAALVILVGLSGTALADGLDDARSAGYLGERADGYLGLVDPSAPADVKALMADINEKREAHYARIAAEQNTSTAAVAAIAGAKLVAKMPPGVYIMGADGKWARK